MVFLHPIYLLLALPLGVSLLVWGYRSRWLFGLRLVTLLLVVLALAGMSLRLPSQAGTVVVLADRSWSMPPGSADKQTEGIDLIIEAMGQEDRLAVVTFGRTVAVERPPEAKQKFPGFAAEVGNDASHMAEALDTALGLIPEGAPGRILVYSDGKWTGRNPGVISAKLAQRNIPIDYRTLSRSIVGDVSIVRLDAPTTVGPSESFLLHGWVQAPTQTQIAYELRRGSKVLASGSRMLDAGLNRLTFRDQGSEPGTQVYVLSIATKEADPVPENNVARRLVGVDGPKPLLVVPSGPKSNFAKLLAAGGLNIKSAEAQPSMWTLENLSNYAGVVLENVPAEQIGYTGMETLAAWVENSGTGLWLTGGRASYGPGGYFKSPLDPILPISMELRQEHRKLSLAIVVALDRSGSMAAPVGGGKVKMDLANLGTAQVLDLLSSNDEFGCIAVDSAPHLIQPLGPVANKGQVRSKILSINSQGGGIFVYEALEASVAMLKDAKAGTRHIILFADAADAEQPGDYEKLLKLCNSMNITVSVIGLGKESHKDGELLKDIAKRGNGRIFFSEEPKDLPRLFAQDTFVVARSAFLDEPTPIRTMPGIRTIVGKDYDPPQVGGYNLTYLRDTANLAAVTVDEYKAPVVASWQAGTGRVLCYTGEVDGQYTGAMAKWKDVGDFFTSLGRWTIGKQEALPDGMLLTQNLKKGLLTVELHLDPRRTTDPFTSLPEATILRAQPGAKPQATRAKLHWETADLLAVEVPLTGTETVLTTVDVPGFGPVALSPVCLPYSPEFEIEAVAATDSTGTKSEGTQGEKSEGKTPTLLRVSPLEKLARITGGKERIELPGIWQEIVRRPRLISLSTWLIVAAVIVLLIEVLERLTGLLSRAGRLMWSTETATATGPAPKAAKVPSKTTETPEETPAAATPDIPPDAPRRKETILEALREAQKRKRQPPS